MDKQFFSRIMTGWNDSGKILEWLQTAPIILCCKFAGLINEITYDQEMLAGMRVHRYRVFLLLLST